MTKQIITSIMLDEARKRGEQSIPLTAGAIITPQARDDARRYGITLVPTTNGIQTPTTPATAPHPMMSPSPIPNSPNKAFLPAPTEQANHAFMSGASIPVQAVPAFVGASCASPETCAALIAQNAHQRMDNSCASEKACTHVMTQPQPVYSCASTEACVRVMPPQSIQTATGFLRKPEIAYQNIPSVPARAPSVSAQTNFAPSDTGNAVFEEARRRVMAALPPNTPQAEVDTLIRNALGETYHVCEGCNTPKPCPVMLSSSQASNAIQRVANVDHVNAQTLVFGTPHSGAIGIMDVLEPTNDATAHVSYMQGENASMTWTPERSEVLVVLEGHLLLSVNGTDITAKTADVLRIGKGQTVTLVTQGLARCTLVSP